jgi:O-antigen ligase
VPASHTQPARSALICLAGGLAVGFIWPFHVNPVPSFSSEWLAGMALLLAAGVFVSRQDQTRWYLPVSALWLVPFAGAIGAQWLLGRAPYAEAVIHALMFVLLAWLVAALVASCVGQNGMDVEAASAPLHWGLWIAAMISGLTAWIQWAGLDVFLSPFVFPMSAIAVHGRPSGNIAQPNLLATLCGLGVVAVSWLWASRRLDGLKAGASVILLLATIGLSGSRTALLFLPAWALVAMLLPKANTRKTMRVWAWIVVPAAMFALHLLVPQLTLQFGSALVQTDVRAASLASDSRLVLWSIAANGIQNLPLLGYGVSTFSQFMVESVAYLPVHDTGLAHHTHNTVLQLILDVGLLAVGLTGVIMCVHCIKAIPAWRPSLERVVAFAGIATLLVHSMLEFPLWYLHFWIVFVWLVAMLDPLVFELPNRRRVRSAAALVLGGSTLAGIWIYSDYWETHRKLRAMLDPAERAQHQTAATPRSLTLYRSYDDYIDHMFGTLPLPLQAGDLERRRKATARHPYPAVLIRMAIIEVLANDQSRADHLLRTLAGMHPQFIDQIQPQFNGACTAFRSQALCAYANTLSRLELGRFSRQ